MDRNLNEEHEQNPSARRKVGNDSENERDEYVFEPTQFDYTGKNKRGRGSPNYQIRSDYKAWPSAEGRETVSKEFKPTLEKPLPAIRCYYVKPNGERCKKFGVRGTGVGGRTNGKAMCFTHGGSLPPVQEMAKAHLDAARMRLVENADLAVETLIELITKSGDQVRLKASTELMDRVGLTKSGADATIEVNHNVSYADEMTKKLQQIKERLQPPAEDEEDEIVDEGEVVEDE